MEEKEMKRILSKYIGEKETEALLRHNKGEQYSVSTSIDGETILAGYGILDYDFEFPLPNFVIKMEFGTLSWNEYLKIKRNEKENKK